MLWLFPIALILLFSLSSEARENGTDTIVVIAGRRVLIHIPANNSGKKIIYFHGYGSTIEYIQKNLLPFFDKAKNPAIIIVPQLGPKSDITNSELKAILDYLKVTEIDIIAHSGGYKATAQLISLLTIRNIALFDALYANLDAYQKFIKSSSSRSFTNICKLECGMSSVLEASVKGNPKATFIVSDVGHTEIPAKYGAQTIDSFIG